MTRRVGRHRARRGVRAAIGRPAAVPVTAFALVCAAAAVHQTAGAANAHAPTVQAAVAVTPGSTPQASLSGQAEHQSSRSQNRPTLPVVPAAKAVTATPSASPKASAAVRPASPAQAQRMARSMLAAYGWSQTQWPCLNKLWTQESSWMTTAENPSSGAYGIPQSLPAGKMATVGADYRTNTRTQLTWGMQYVRDAYGSPCAAWDFHLAHNWY
ncbi:hypothetical protein [Branchiibius cervicis]|uniref:Lytic transglycosylase domain-containing protein n=1 Tax=Branchiibius cervicis TaxID=908252 RepID=A0ABW2AVA2_9MICO